MRKLKAPDETTSREPRMAPQVSAPLSGDETIDNLVAGHPGLRPSLLSYGICTCCSGTMTLRQYVRLRGLPLSMILDDLNRDLAQVH